MVRPSSWLPLGVLAFLVALSWWLDQLVQPAPSRPSGALRHDPDMIVDNFNARAFGEDGRTLYTLVARRMVHYPDDSSAHLERIGMEAYEPRQPRLTIASDRGRMLEGGDQVWLEGNVVVVREADQRFEEARLFTDKLLVLPNDGVARTSSPVLLQSASGRVQSQGLELNNRSRVLKLQQVSAVYKPPRR